MPQHLVYGLDIETEPLTSSWGVAPVERTDEVPVVDPRTSTLTRAVLSTPGGDRTFEGDEDRLLTELDAALAGLEPGVLATWNGSGFGLPFLADRAWIRGVRLGLHLAADPRLPFRFEMLPGHRCAYRAAWYDHRHLDAARLYRSGRRPLVAVDDLFRVIGLPSRLRPRRGGTDASVPLEHDLVHAHATNDAKLVRSLIEARLPGVMRHIDRITLHHTPSAEGALRSAGLGRIPLSPAHPAVRAALAGTGR